MRVSLHVLRLDRSTTKLSGLRKVLFALVQPVVYFTVHPTCHDTGTRGQHTSQVIVRQEPFAGWAHWFQIVLKIILYVTPVQDVNLTLPFVYEHPRRSASTY